MMAGGGRQVVLVPLGAWVTMLAGTIVATSENALRSKSHEGERNGGTALHGDDRSGIW